MVLFAYCYRDSLTNSEDLKKFFGTIKDKRIDMINKVGGYNIPILAIKE